MWSDEANFRGQDQYNVAAPPGNMASTWSFEKQFELLPHLVAFHASFGSARTSGLTWLGTVHTEDSIAWQGTSDTHG